ncbi:hypothetical protein ACIBCT_38750 [Streptosporangium sp. NPDC050855]|uniref:hypothetical protein n=1 Tax=Streptosporangium sp. NPDC050855 TaxID=3366194 RepID=UPI00378C9CFB
MNLAPRDIDTIPRIIPTHLIDALADAGEHLADWEQAAIDQYNHDVVTAHQETNPTLRDLDLRVAHFDYALALHTGGNASTAARRTLGYLRTTEKPYSTIDGIAHPTVEGMALLLGVTAEEFRAEVQRQCGDSGNAADFQMPPTWTRHADRALKENLATHGVAGLLPATLNRLAAERSRAERGPHA